MKVEDFYAFQSTARGLHNDEDIQALVRAYAPIYRRLLEKWLPTGKNALIYEAACGNGIFLRWARSEGYGNLKGSDISEKEIARARGAGFDVEHGDSVRAIESSAEGSIDCIVAIDFMEHVPKEVFMEFLRASWRALKPGGCLLMRGPNGDSPFVGLNLYNDITHVWCYTSTSLRAIARMAGFSEINFADDTTASIQRYRLLKLPFMIIAQAVLRLLIRTATHEQIPYLGSSFYICARK